MSTPPPFRLPPGGVPLLERKTDKRVGPDTAALLDELHTLGAMFWTQFQRMGYSLDAIASPYNLPHVPCVAPVLGPDGEPGGFGVYCFACSFGEEHRDDPEFVYCQRDDIDVSEWPPQRVVAAPEFTEFTDNPIAMPEEGGE
jgi:hypothetical protein